MEMRGCIVKFLSAGLRVDSGSGEVLRDCFGRPISLDPEPAEMVASERWETDLSFPELPSPLLSSHSWKKVMADKWFFDDDIRREAWAWTADRAARSQPVHDCRILLPSDNASPVDDPRDFRLLTQIRRFVCRNIRISIRWVPSEFNSSGGQQRT